MTLSKYSKRHVQFESLEAKKLFAADLVGGAVADLPDTAIVAEAENIQWEVGRDVAENARTNIGGIRVSLVAQEGAQRVESGLGEINGFVSLRSADSDLIGSAAIEANDRPNDNFQQLGGQEGEDVVFDGLMIDPEGLVNNISGMDSSTEIVEFEHHNDLFANLGGQEGEPVMDHIVSDQVWDPGGHPTDGPLF